MITETISFLTTAIIFGNELWRYLIFVVFLALTWPIGKLINYILNNFLKKWAEKTSFKLDDILINSLNPPINMFILAAMFYFGMDFISGAPLPILKKLFNFLLIVPFVYFLIKFSTEAIGFYLKEGRENKSKVNEAAVDLLMQVIRILLFLIGILLILANLGYNISALLAGLGVGGLAFALAAQDILKNFFAGIALIFDEAFKKGERVNFQGQAGFIENVTLRSTKLRTYDSTILTIPNAMLADNIVENVSRVPRVKVKMTIGVTYDTSVKKLKEAKKIIYNAVKNNSEANEEACDIWFDNYGPYSLDIQVIYYAKKLSMRDWPARIHMKEDVNFAIKEGFEKAKIDMAFPTQTIELKK